MLYVLIFKLFRNIKCTVIFSDAACLTLMSQGNVQIVQSKTVLTLSNKNKENMLFDGIFEKKEENYLFILKQKIFLASHLLNTDAHSYILLPITMEQSYSHLHYSKEVSIHKE